MTLIDAAEGGRQFHLSWTGLSLRLKPRLEACSLPSRPVY